MRAEGILGCPVLDEHARYCGFVDMLDLVAFTVRQFDIAGLDPDIQGYAELLDRLHEFWDAKVSDVLELGARRSWSRDPVRAVQPGITAFEAMERFINTGAHRMPVLDEMGRVIGLCTESMLISVLGQQLGLLGQARNLTVRELNKDLCNEVYAVHEGDRALSAFRRMADLGVHGLAVFDRSDALVDVLTVRDLRGIGNNANRFKRLFLSVKAFKEYTRNEFGAQTPPAPLYVTPDATLAKVVQVMDDGNIHRVFECEEEPSRMGGKWNRLLPRHCISQKVRTKGMCYIDLRR